MDHLTIARPSTYRDDHSGNRVRFSNSWGVMRGLRAARGSVSRDTNQQYDPSSWSSPQPQVQDALEPTTSLSIRRPHSVQLERWLPCAALSPCEWMRLTATL